MPNQDVPAVRINRSSSPSNRHSKAEEPQCPEQSPKAGVSSPPTDTILGMLQWSAPSALTLGALMCGLSAVRFAAEGDFGWSVKFVLCACALDGLDGHVARFLGTSSSIGFEMDSLCDLANFGVTPALIVYFWVKSLPSSECNSEGCRTEYILCWFACCIFASCCCLRLARFNVAGHAEKMDQQFMSAEKHSPRPPVLRSLMHNVRQKKMYFQGVPAPVGAAYALAPMMLRLSLLPRLLGAVGERGAWAIGRNGTAMLLLVTAGLMVSPMPTLSSKMLKTDKDDTHLRSRGIASKALKLCGFAGLCYVTWRFPFEVVLLLDLGHLLSIPVGVLLFRCYASEKTDKTH
eukprot:TRINITY_DN58633_c0_g1_i1.p1 TRINITY_DN58633_c0_g1~~TRINITY_DN58633_c0_g1_i1.p1  ORF type:complete len:347 (+),score=36.05 TRINITY_DN58633_c0_g1_i1:62-1102(+)